MEALVGDILSRVQNQSGAVPLEYNVFKNMGAFVVSAPAPFVRKLLARAGDRDRDRQQAERGHDDPAGSHPAG